MRKRGLEPLRGNPHYHLKVARIPIPPLSLSILHKNKYNSTLSVSRQPDSVFLIQITFSHIHQRSVQLYSAAKKKSRLHKFLDNFGSRPVGKAAAIHFVPKPGYPPVDDSHITFLILEYKQLSAKIADNRCR